MRAGEPDRLAEVALAAAEASLERLAFEEAARIAEQALGLVTPGGRGRAAGLPVAAGRR